MAQSVAVPPVRAPRIEETAARAALGVSESAWTRLMGKVRTAMEADCVFTVDAEGLVIARTGAYGRAEVDRVAAHVSRAFDFVDPLTEIGSAVETVCIRFEEGRWLTAIRVAPRDDVTVTLAVIGPHTVLLDARDRIREVFQVVFARE